MTEHSPVAIWAAILLIGVATYLIRLSFIHLFGRIDDVPPALERALRFVPPAVLAGLVAPAVITVGPTLEATIVDERLLAAVLAGAVAWRTEDMFATIGAGMVAFWVLRFVVM
ncbi:Branched-chain amino acid transport protein [Halopenitus malekzadehii]|uniref:Branched-chain amino acid transport protein n=1 Tax=Halopenitus malekzadehii TaxID=1267564 RepID=A0A1H6IT57_9EURY|nr:AzlD domain-containing protein [Halopenitus malekzadehii]SEH49851.1 Branched-chain amino acid transport protein [Halopenitus malekzadehii]